MKRILWLVLTSLIFLGTGPVLAQEKLVVDPPQVTLSKKANVHIKGSGFAPGQEVAILFVAVDGVMSDIGFALNPEPVADVSGNWATTWKCGRFIKKKLIKAGTYTIKAADVDYNVLAETEVTFVPGK